MWIENAIHFEDLKNVISNKNIFGDKLEGKTFFVTGATGLIGQNIVNALLYFGLETAKNIKVLAFVRNLEKAQEVLEHDDIVDHLFDEVKAELIEMIHQNKEIGEQATDLLMVAKYFERIGDHATNIAEWVIYSITGEHESVS